MTYRSLYNVNVLRLFCQIRFSSCSAQMRFSHECSLISGNEGLRAQMSGVKLTNGKWYKHRKSRQPYALVPFLLLALQQPNTSPQFCCVQPLHQCADRNDKCYCILKYKNQKQNGQCTDARQTKYCSLIFKCQFRELKAYPEPQTSKTCMCLNILTCNCNLPVSACACTVIDTMCQ